MQIRYEIEDSVWREFKADCVTAGRTLENCLNVVLSDYVELNPYRDLLLRALHSHDGSTLGGDLGPHEQARLTEAMKVLRRTIRK